MAYRLRAGRRISRLDRSGRFWAAAGLLSAAVLLWAGLEAQASPNHPTVVSENPADTTPHIPMDDEAFNVYAFEQVGSTMYAGGRFAEVQDPAKTTTYPRQNFVAFDAETGVISPLNLEFNGLVTAIEASDDETALFISGAFSQINGIPSQPNGVIRRGIAKYDLVNNQIDPTFAPTGMRTVSAIELVNGSLIAAGNFSKHVMEMDPTTGADLGTIDITVTGVLDPADETRVRKIAVSPDGTRLVATGNFTTVNGQGRERAFMLNLGSTATLSTWHAPRFDVECNAASRLVTAQGVDFSPDGSYFVIVATGYTGLNGICDAAARFETANVSSTVEPTWINWTGGDTLYSVAITEAAVYVGGHQRWLDNPQGADFPGPGAVSRPGIGAIDPVSGMALPWNPTKSRNHGTLALFPTPDGLWVGSDGERFGHEDHAGIGFAPLDPSPTPDTTRPNTFIDSGPSGSVSDTSATFGFSADEPSTFQCRLVGAAFAPCTSPVTYEDLTVGPHTFQVVAVDGSFNMDASPAEQVWTVLAPGSELVGNPGFEIDTSGWKGDNSANTLTRVPGGHSGNWAVDISKTDATGSCGIDDNPNWVTSTTEGNYTSSIWARSDHPGIILHLRIREYSDGVRQGTANEDITLTSSWQQITTNYTPVIPGSVLNFEAYTKNAPAGVCFQADDASITHNDGAPPDTTPPDTFIDSGPSGSVSDTSATFGFSADEPSTFQCRLDGAAFAPCTSPVTYEDLTVGPHTFQVVATDGSSNTDPTPAEQAWTIEEPGGELVGNPGFEIDTSGWKGDNSANTLTRVPGGHSGNWAVDISKTDATGSCGIDDNPNWVTSTTEGNYTSSIWARSDHPGIILHLRIREYSDGVRQGTANEDITLTSSWQQITTNYTPVIPGSVLNFEAYTKNAPAGVCFQADDASITHNDGAPPDTTPPDTFIDSGPSGSVSDTSATFGFSADEPSTFQCRLDGAAFAPCTSPVTYEDLTVGPHTFQVVATDGSSNTDPTPAEQAWTIEEPGGELVGNPGFEIDTSGWKGDNSANTLTRVPGGHSGNWAVDISKTDATGSCGIDDNPNWVTSTTEGNYTSSIWARSDHPGIILHLRIREYSDGVRQGTANEDITLTSSWQQITTNYTPVIPGSVLNFEAYTKNAPAGVCFQADDASITHNDGAPPDTTPPDTFIDSGPSGSVSDTSATFGFSADEPSTFQCRLDGAAFAPCTSPVTYEDLTVGPHTFQVVATDGSSNTDPTPAEQAWTIEEPGGELVGNPGFEIDTSGWKGDNSANTLTRVPGGHSGNWAVDISKTDATGSCGIDDNPNWVTSTTEGNYTSSIWARSDHPGIILHLRIREYSDGVRQGTANEDITLTSSWQQITTNYTPVIPGSVLNFEAYTKNAPAGVCFQADDASITHNDGAP